MNKWERIWFEGLTFIYLPTSAWYNYINDFKNAIFYMLAGIATILWLIYRSKR